MKRYHVGWTHIHGGSNTELVLAKSESAAKQIIEDRQGASNLMRVWVLK